MKSEGWLRLSGNFTSQIRGRWLESLRTPFATLLAFLMVLCLVLPGHAASCDPAPTNLVSWWAAEGNANDSFGNNNGTLQNGASFATGLVGQAFSFNGTNQWVDVTNSPALSPTNSFTIEGWINVTGDGSSTYVIMGKWGGVGVNYRSYAFDVLPNYALGFTIADAAHQGDAVFQTFNTANNVVASNVWAHVAAVYDQSTGVRKIYVNGTNIANQTNTAITVLNTPLDPGIGAQLGNVSTPQGFFVGKIDELSFYNRALSTAEIQGIYSAGSAGKCLPPPLITSQPTNQSATVGGGASFSVSATGGKPLGYQWQLNTTNISVLSNATATSPTLVLTNLQLAQSGGVYSVIVSNSGGQTNSSNAVLTVNGPSCTTAPSGLVDWWQGEGNALDAAGGINGTLVGGVSYTAGEVGQAFSFDGSTGYVSNAVPLLANVNNSFTMEFWAFPTGGRNPTGETSTGVQGYFSQRYVIFPHQVSGSGGAGVGVSVGTNGISVFEHADNYLPCLLEYDATITNWTHIAVVYINRTPTLYVNGVQVLTGLTSGRPVSYASTDLGEDGHGYGYYSGLLDEVSIYNRSLSAAEIQGIYNAGAGGKCPTPPVIAAQPINQTAYTGQTVTFSVNATGSLPLAYQWKFNSTNILASSNATATNATLVITNAQLAQAGSYSVMISNPSGSTNSTNASLTVIPPGSCTPSPSGLVGWWAGEGNGNDSFSTNNGSLVGGVTFTNGEVGRTFVFDGSTGYVDVPDSPALRISSTITVEGWINPALTNGDQAILSKIATGNLNGYQFALTAGNQLVGAFNGPGQGWPSQFIKTPISCIPGTWNHVAWTYDQSDMKLYFNGQLVASNNIGPQAIATSSSDLYIGGPGPSSFHGMIDEFSVYNRVLSAAEIQGLYFAGSIGKCGNPPTIVSQPVGQTVPAGQPASFSVSATGMQPFSYQWYSNSSPVSLATNSSFAVANAQSNASISVRITNPAGLTNSSNALLTIVPPSCATPPSGLIGWWAGEGNAGDSFGTNNGSLVGGVTFTNGEAGRAFYFNGTSAYVDVPDNATLRLTNQFTFDVWVNPATISVDQSIIAKLNGAVGLNGYQMGLIHGGGIFGQFNSPGQGWPSSVITAQVPIDTNTWSHLAWTYDQSVMKLYFDGQLVATNLIGPQVVATSTSDFFIGGLGPLFQGAVDEAGVYNRALSAAEIQAIYLAGSAGKCGNPPVIVAQPRPLTLPAGSTAMFNVTATGMQPFIYQWYSNSTAISTATNASLLVSNAQVSALYSVAITNLAGSSNSTSATLTVVQPSCDTLPSGLVGWWAGEGNANDSFSTNNGSLSGGATFAGGEVGQAFNFNGSTAFVQVPDNTNWDFGTNDFSIELWAEFATSNQNCFPVGHDDGGGARNKWDFYLNSGVMQFHINTTGNNAHYIGAGSFIPVTNQWYQLAVTRASGSNYTFYVNGGIISTVTDSTPVPVATAPLTFGQAEGGGYVNGREDEISIYRRALSQAEIQAVYFAGTAGKCGNPPVIVAQPQPLTLPAGSTATFNVTATGMQPFVYQWYSNSTSIPSATNGSLLVSNAQVSALYSVAITNPAGSSNSASALLTVVAPSCVTPPSGVISWWPGEFNGNDVAGTNNGSLVGGVPFVWGEVDESFSFNGTSQYVSVPKSPTLNVSNQATIEFWINSDPANPIGSRIEGLVTCDYYGVEMAPGNGMYFYVSTNGGSTYLLTSDVNSGGLTFATGQWHHVAATYNGTNIQMYLDGQPAGAPRPAAGNISPMGASSSFTIAGENGRGGGLSGRNYKGLLDEVGLYNRALSPAEIQGIYYAGIAGKCKQPRQALATAVVTNGFLVGFTMNDAGFGYVTPPKVRVVGGGGSGAVVTAIVSNGIVTGLQIMDAGSGYTGTPTIVIAPTVVPNPTLGIAAEQGLVFSNVIPGGSYQLQQAFAWYWSNVFGSVSATDTIYAVAYPGTPDPATFRLATNPVPLQPFATAQVVNGFVVGATMTSHGSGYTSAPLVTIVGGGGAGAAAVANLNGNTVSNITIMDAGSGYTSTPLVEIAPPPVMSLAPIVLPGMRLDASNLAPYDNYQIQFQNSLGAGWQNWGTGGFFVPTGVTNSTFLIITNGSDYFRLQYLP